MLEQTTKMNLLYDFYHPLLTEKQRLLIEMYYLDDWSLSEIAEHQGVTRQAVFESIKRAGKVLMDLEEKLHLIQKYRQRQQIAERLLAQLEKYSEAKAVAEPLIRKMID
jgi:predicted DNA-binding protein YlxM (UPF0122 family)